MTKATRHSPEPWRYEADLTIDGPEDANGKLIMKADEYLVKDMHRIVACVNACRGIPNDELDLVILHGFRDMASLNDTVGEKQPEWLTKALEMRK